MTSLPSPKVVEVEATTLCNAKCIFCPRWLFKIPTFLEEKTFEMILSRLKDYGVKKVSGLKFAGLGEPTMHPGIMGMLRKTRKAGLSPILNTNGARLHLLGIKEILKVVDEVIVSCHSLVPGIHKEIFGVDIFHTVRANLDALLKENEAYGRTITLYIVVTKMNPDTLKDFEIFGDKIRLVISGCTNRTLDRFSENLIEPTTAQTYNHYPVISEKNPLCGFSTSAVVIDSSGKYLVCTNDVQRKTELGNIWNMSVRDMLRLRTEKHLALVFLDDLCENCDNNEIYLQKSKNTF